MNMKGLHYREKGEMSAGRRKGHIKVERKRTTGVTLAELVITVTLFGFIIMLLFNLYPSSIGALKHAQLLFESSGLAQSKLEEIRRQPFTVLDNPPGPINDAFSDGTTYQLKYDKIDMKLLDSTINTDMLKGIRITISWKERSNEYKIFKDLYISKIQR
jgi:hypothetical protein